MKKNLILIALMFLMVAPLMSFKSDTASQPQKVKKIATVYLGQFTKDGGTFHVYGNDVNHMASEVYYENGYGGLVPVYNFVDGSWMSSSPVYIAHLRIYSGPFTTWTVYTGYLDIIS